MIENAEFAALQSPNKKVAFNMDEITEDQSMLKAGPR
jgi:hypothetical protein